MLTPSLAAWSSRSLPAAPATYTLLGMDEALSGLISGAASTLALQPLDLLKVRYQARGNMWSATGQGLGGLGTTVANVWRREGLRGFFAGASAAVVGSAASWGLYFFFYDSYKSWAKGALEMGEDERLQAWQNGCAALAAGMSTTCFTNPIWLIKTRLQLQDQGVPGKRPYRGMLDAARQIVAEEGIAGLYRGITPALFLAVHGLVQFSVYEELKAWHGLPEQGGGDMTSGPLAVLPRSAGIFIMGAASKVLATAVTYPYQVAKTRMQQRLAVGHSVYGRLWPTLLHIARTEGVAELYAGFLPNLLRVVPSSALTLSIYEAVKPRLAWLS